MSCSVCEVNRDRKDRGELYNVLARLGRKAKGLQNLRFAGVVAPSSLEIVFQASLVVLCLPYYFL